MSQLAAGVVMVTARVAGRPWGLTVSACCSVSMSPPLLLVSLQAQTALAKAVRSGGVFGVGILGEHQLDIARFGSTVGQPKFIERYCDASGETQVSSTPIIADATAHIHCTVHKEVKAGDHLVFLGEVQQVLLDGDAQPLVYHSKSYRTITDLEESRTPVELQRFLHIGGPYHETFR
jgi:flavin reductase ActVB